MNMKKLIESMDHIEECGMTEDPMPTAMPGADAGQPVSMNVSINASGKDHVADLIDMMKNAGMSAAEPVGAPSLGMRGDMEKFRSAMDDDPEIPGDDDNPDDTDLKAGTLGAIGGGALGMALGGPLGALTGAAAGDSLTDEELATEDDLEEYANEPDPQYGDMSDAIPDGNDLNRKKKAYAATQDGDNPMAVEAIKATLMAALAEKKKPDANKNGIPDYAEDGKGPNDLAKGKKGSKPKKGEVPPQFKKKGTDEGGQTKDCPKCGAPGKKELMACSSCGCS
jgi:hypothetical protein|tara:strand:+ start:1680 stop:2522 length:843 start_codon:yes stop_codon:yes gene_type:complete